jgi:hypothetical protein
LLDACLDLIGGVLGCSDHDRSNAADADVPDNLEDGPYPIRVGAIAPWPCGRVVQDMKT